MEVDGAHPRSRGENGQRVDIAQPRAGSSPLTRGKHVVPKLGTRFSGLIPAHAGKTARVGRPLRSAGAHPRSRGENRRLLPACVGCRGSSPLTRGKRAGWSATTKRWGLIPAHAGKTHAVHVTCWDAEAHPRSRGENVVYCLPASAVAGSSPLTRGKRDGVLLGKPEGRLIPAHAGKTATSCGRCPPITAHPRSRGENVMNAFGRESVKGSSPLTRGKQVINKTPHALSRLIPAHAGKTQRRASRAFQVRAHPRSRGENHASSCQIVRSNGSSPLTRGKLVRRRREGRRGRLIPAHAGKTPRSAAHWR